MAHYLVEVRWDDPYPKVFNYRTVGSNIGLGAYRALKQFRKENKGRRIKSVSLKVNQYATAEIV